MNQKTIKPQKGFQEKFLTSEADILIGGGSAGGGKTFALLMDILHYLDVNGFGAVMFRRTTPQITSQGGLWDTSMEIYPYLGASPKQSKTSWIFPKLQKLKFSHLEYEKDKLSWQGSQIAYIAFDELTQFSIDQFLYLLSRNRSVCNMKPCIRATCNPDPDSWVAEFIKWWIDQETGFPIPERDGVLRYFIRDSEEFVWGNTKQEVVDKCPHVFNKKEFKNINTDDLIKSATFVRGDIYGNKELLEKDPSYLANLNALNEKEKAQLLDGNWKIKLDGLSLFEHDSIGDLFSNFVKDRELKCITCDVARFGKDLAVIKTWEGLACIKIYIFTKCKTTKIVEYIESERERCSIRKSACLIDQDGVGGGVVDDGGYVGFSGGKPVHVNKKDKRNKFKENYKNLKTQCAYKMSEKVNAGLASVDLTNIFVDGIKTNKVKVKNKTYNVKKLIEDDLKSFKRDKIDKDFCKQIIPKEKQKIILGGRSPDCGDAIIMRMFFELDRPKKNYISFA